MTRSRILRAGAAIPLFVALLFAGCASTTSDTQSIMDMSTLEALEPEMWVGDQEDLKLPEQSPGNVNVFYERPEFAYFVVDTFLTTFSYEKDSMTDKDIEKKEHLKNLRLHAGREGANGLIVVFGKDEKNVGGATNYDMMESEVSGGRESSKVTTVYREGNFDVVNSDKYTIVNVLSYAIYRRLE